MKVGVLTSSRADFGIYLPLLRKLDEDEYFDLEIIAFGTHLSKKFGLTITEIKEEGFVIKHSIETLPENDSPVSIALSISKSAQLFSVFWNNNVFDLVFALGDRYEMFAAVLAGSPFNVKFAHIHAGETTLGAIDNAYRHSISLMSKYLFVSTEEYKKRAIELIQRPNDVFSVGALSMDNLKSEKFYSISEFESIFGLNLSIPTILTTFHPETVDFLRNESYINELLSALEELSTTYQIVITMPNSDTEGLMIREKIESFADQNKEVVLVESFGMKGYLSCMKYCSLMIGNTSSAFVEAAFFPKWVINLGNRQEGRINTPNIYTIPIKRKEIVEIVKRIEDSPKLPRQSNIYGNGNTASQIMSIITKLYGIK